MPNIEFLQEYEFLGNTMQQYLYASLTVVIFAVCGYIAKYIIHRKFKIWSQKTSTKLDDVLVRIWRKIAGFLIFVAGLYVAMGFLTFEDQVGKFVNIGILMILTFKVTRVIQFLFNTVLTLYMRPLSEHSKVLDDQFVNFFRKLGNVVIWVLAALFVLANMDVNITSLVTGLGIGGLALALGAQETISNIFASLSLLGDKPFRTGDWVTIDGVEGTVKELGLRSVRLETFDGTEVLIPTKKAAAAVIENIDRRQTVKAQYTVAIDNVTEQATLVTAMEEIRKYLKAFGSEVTDFRVNLEHFDEHALNLLVQYWVADPFNWPRFLEVRTEVNLKIKAILEEMNVQLARRFKA